MTSVWHCGLVGAVAVLALSLPLPAPAQQDVERGLKQYRDMMRADPLANPGWLDADRGEALWRERRGPRQASLEACDLGRGPGVVEGAFAELPRYFADAGRVMDLEARLLWCMERLQGITRAELVREPYPAANQPTRDLGALATFIATRSNGRKLAPQLRHRREREALALGEALFYRRQGPMDFACVTCHGQDGKRIRLQELVHLSRTEEARKVIGEWPAYRVSTAHVMTMQHRIYDCFWQMRMPAVEIGSEVPVALIMYLARRAEGGEVNVPGLKR